MWPVEGLRLRKAIGRKQYRRSELGEGATFTFYLSCAEGAVELALELHAWPSANQMTDSGQDYATLAEGTP
jgi:hypothetical protein